MCVDKNANSFEDPRSKKNYVLHALKNYKRVQAELDQMEKCEEYMYNNSLNIFSMALGPFEKFIESSSLKNNGLGLEGEVELKSMVNPDNDGYDGDEDLEANGMRKPDPIEILQKGQIQFEVDEFITQINDGLIKMRI